MRICQQMTVLGPHTHTLAGSTRAITARAPRCRRAIPEKETETETGMRAGTTTTADESSMQLICTISFCWGILYPTTWIWHSSSSVTVAEVSYFPFLAYILQRCFQMISGQSLFLIWLSSIPVLYDCLSLICNSAHFLESYVIFCRIQILGPVLFGWKVLEEKHR